MSPPTPSGTVRGIPAATLALAEDTNAFGSVPVGCERLVEPGYVIWLSPRPGAPALVVQAGAMSFPILQRCGFVETCRIQILLDEMSAA
jgi:hypothetical protein